MRLNFPLLDESIAIEQPTIIVLEEVQVFANFVRSIYDYENSNVRVFDAKFKTLKSTEMLVVTDLIGFDLNSSTVLKNIFADIAEYLNENPDVKTKVEKIMISANDIISDVLIEHELDLQTSEMTLHTLFKALNINVNNNSESIHEKVADIIQVFKYLSKKKLLVFVNVCSYLTRDELQETIRYLSLNNVTSLFIEPRAIKGAGQYILDKDFFLSYENML